MEKLGVVHLEEHTSDLTGKLGLSLVDQGVKGLTEHLLLLGRSSPGQRLGIKSASLRGRRGLLVGSSGHLATSRDGTSGETLGSTDGAGATVTGTVGVGGSRDSGTTGSDRVTGSTGVRNLRRHTVGGNTTGQGLAVGVESGSGLHHVLGGTGVAHHRATDRGHTRHGLTVSGHGRVAVHGLAHVTLHAGETSTVLHSLLSSLGNLGLEGLSTNVLSLSKSDVKGLGADHLAVHLRDSLGGLIGGRVADETKAPRDTTVVPHNLGGSDGTESLKLSTETVIIPLVCTESKPTYLTIDEFFFTHHQGS